MSDLDLELDLALEIQHLEHLAAEMPCENSYHTERPEHHDGPARWYVMLSHTCENVPRPILLAYCEKFTQWVIANPHTRVKCTDCEKTMDMCEFYKVLARIESL